jgi:hypothetical protein
VVAQGKQLAALCRGEVDDIVGPPGWGWTCLGVVIAASAAYGATVGWWQAPQQAVYAALKFPLLILATVAGNALLNAMLAQVLGVPLTFRQSWLAILMGFVVATLMLAAFAPVSLFLALTAPRTDQGYSVVLLMHVGAIAYAGVAANARLWRLLLALSGCRRRARRVLLAWLAGNLLVGTQVSWIISPFIGDPTKPVMWIQEHPFRRNFFEYAAERAQRLAAEHSEVTHE